MKRGFTPEVFLATDPSVSHPCFAFDHSVTSRTRSGQIVRFQLIFRCGSIFNTSLSVSSPVIDSQFTCQSVIGSHTALLPLTQNKIGGAAICGEEKNQSFQISMTDVDCVGIRNFENFRFNAHLLQIL